MAFKGLVSTLLACLFVIAAVNAASFSVSSVSSVDVGTWTDYIYVTASEGPQSNSLSVSIAASSGDVTLSTTTLNFNQVTRSLSFRARSNVVGSYTITFTKNGDTTPDPQFADLAPTQVSFNYRTFDVDELPDYTYVNEPSEPLKITVSTAPDNDLTLTPTTDNSSIVINGGSPIVIRAGTRSASYVFRGSKPIAGDLVTWVISGSDAGFWPDTALDGVWPFAIAQRPFQFPSTINPNVLVAFSGYNGLYIYTRQLANNSFTVTPQAADTTFTPTSASFSSSTQTLFFTYTTTSPANKRVYFSVSGAGASDYVNQVTIPSVALKVPRRQVSVKLSSTYVVTNTTHMSIVIPAPAAKSLVVSFWAANVAFNQSSVTFSGNTTAWTVAVRAISLGPDTVTFRLSGDDADYYLPIPDMEINNDVIRGNFVNPPDWYLPRLYVGEESPKIPIRASISPIKEVTLTPTAPNLDFIPPSLTFRNGTEQHYFTIVPRYTNSFGSDGQPTSYSTTVEWLINGTDATIFDIPSSFSVSVSPRFIQTAWSAHLTTDNLNDESSGLQYLHKTYKIWVSANYVGPKDQVSVTPVSPYYSFKPAVLFFDASHTRFELEATVTGVAPGGGARIDYILGGKDGGLYAPVGTADTYTALRPLKIVAAVVSPDERVTDRKKAVYITENRNMSYSFNAASVLYNNHVYSFLLRSFVLPDKSLTITPHSPHVDFSPSKITIHPGDGVKRIDYTPTIWADYEYEFNITGVYLEANFSAKAKAAGHHLVTFELSGDDKDYYLRPDDITMTFNLVMRPDSEPYRVSSSSFLFPSFLVVAVMAVFSLVM